MFRWGLGNFRSVETSSDPCDSREISPRALEDLSDIRLVAGSRWDGAAVTLSGELLLWHTERASEDEGCALEVERIELETPCFVWKI